MNMTDPTPRAVSEEDREAANGEQLINEAIGFWWAQYKPEGNDELFDPGPPMAVFIRDYLVSHGWGPKPAEQAKANEPCLAETRDMLWFVASRYIKDGPGANFREGRCTGVSSDALAFYGIGMRGEPKDHEYPADQSDLAACERTYEMAPSRVQERMLPVLQSYRLAVASEAQEREEED